ncbi:hypothetical protein GCM10014713_43420 [Streptomyces purpureus]|uniref:Uncharacterized protein n=1 Tax=Streptomyces purpureus TaxID=1951 RepID=A0A918H8K8_9ACTN|nr:hypothetical protein GCM10014713_43420 [Streptomyces purpureus]
MRGDTDPQPVLLLVRPGGMRLRHGAPMPHDGPVDPVGEHTPEPGRPSTGRARPRGRGPVGGAAGDVMESPEKGRIAVHGSEPMGVA